MAGTVAESLTKAVHVLHDGEQVGPFKKALCGAPLTSSALVTTVSGSVTCEGCQRRYDYMVAEPVGKGQ